MVRNKGLLKNLPDPDDEGAVERWRKEHAILYDEELFPWIRDELRKILAPAMQAMKPYADAGVREDLTTEWVEDTMHLIVRQHQNVTGQLKIKEILMDCTQIVRKEKNESKMREVAIFRFSQQLFGKQNVLVKEREEARKKKIKARWHRGLFATSLRVVKQFNNAAPLKTLNCAPPVPAERKEALSIGISKRAVLPVTESGEVPTIAHRQIANPGFQTPRSRAAAASGDDSPFSQFRQTFSKSSSSWMRQTSANPLMLTDVDPVSVPEPNPYMTDLVPKDGSPDADWATRILGQAEEARKKNEQSLAHVGATLPTIRRGVPAPPSFLPTVLAPVGPHALAPVAPPLQDQYALKFPEVTTDDRTGVLVAIVQQENSKDPRKKEKEMLKIQSRRRHVPQEMASSLNRMQPMGPDGTLCPVLPILSLRCPRPASKERR